MRPTATFQYFLKFSSTFLIVLFSKSLFGCSYLCETDLYNMDLFQMAPFEIDVLKIEHLATQHN